MQASSCSRNGLQEMEVVEVNTAIAVENQPVVDPPLSGKFMWKIENFSEPKMHLSDVFISGGYKWRIIVCKKVPYDHLSMYLQVEDVADFPYKFKFCVKFDMTVFSHRNPKYIVRHGGHHQFSATERHSGFIWFIPLSELHNPSRGYILNDTITVEAGIAVEGLEAAYDSKKETGYVGIKESCFEFMNSLLQILYHIPYFRKVVHLIPLKNFNMLSTNVLLDLRTLFYKLQYCDNRVSLKRMMHSFGFVIGDVLNSNRNLCEVLELEMKETVYEGRIRELFEGRCLKSSGIESFFGLLLDVRGCQDVYDSFDKYVGVESIEGDNNYDAGEHGRQLRCYFFLVDGEQYSIVGASQALNSQVIEATIPVHAVLHHTL